MKTLVLKQPWASLVLEGKKTIELRTWQTKYRGPILIVAGRGIDRADAERLGWKNGPRGVALCIVDLVNISPATEKDTDSACCAPDVAREFSWRLLNPRSVKHIEMIGRLGLYDVDVSDSELGL